MHFLLNLDLVIVLIGEYIPSCLFSPHDEPGTTGNFYIGGITSWQMHT